LGVQNNIEEVTLGVRLNIKEAASWVHINIKEVTFGFRLNIKEVTLGVQATCLNLDKFDFQTAAFNFQDIIMFKDKNKKKVPYLVYL
jgi:hypothetical protein